MQVVVQDPEHMNLLGLILGSRLRRGLQHPDASRKLARLKGCFRLQAGDMSVFLCFEPDRLRVTRDEPDKVRAWVRGGFDAFVGVALGRGMVRPVLGRRVRFGGNPFPLLRLVGLLTLDPARHGPTTEE